MPFFVAVTALFALSAGYLLHQFWTRAFAADAPPIDALPDADPAPESLRAA
ncbi:MAG: hypothetical protein M3P30_07550 [Chloroflexota bacterium]|nr:hypothetical protein [Chloroflexota bacterium]